MKIAKKYSHLNAEEWLQIHRKETYHEIFTIIAEVRAEKDLDPVHLKAAFSHRLAESNWQATRYDYYIAHTSVQSQAMARMTLEEQALYLQAQESEALLCCYQMGHVKDQVAVEIGLDTREAMAYDLFVKHLAFYTGRIINVGIEILPTKAMQKEMSSGIAYYEGELHNILRHGRSHPPVPLVLIGLEP